MDLLSLDLAAYYDQESTSRAERSIDPLRVVRRAEFVAVLHTEARRNVVELGTGPGRDAAAFLAAGLAVSGVDLSAEHVRLARGAGIDAIQASLFDLPYDDARFDAAWTMSTLVHVPDARFHEAMGSIVRVVAPGAPVAIGTWGGEDHEGIAEFDTLQPPRFFSRRSNERFQEMLAEHGDVERFDTWTHSISGWQYQYAILRTRSVGNEARRG